LLKIKSFKPHLDKFWANQEILYDYKADPDDEIAVLKRSFFVSL